MEQGSWYTVYYLVSYPLYLYYYNINQYYTRIRYWSMYYVQCNVQPSDCNHSRDSSVEWARREHGIHWAGMHVIQYPLYIPYNHTVTQPTTSITLMSIVIMFINDYKYFSLLAIEYIH